MGSYVEFNTAPENSLESNELPTLEVCDGFSLVASRDNRLYVLGGSGATKHLRRFELDDTNSIATVRAVRASGTSPSPRWGHCAVVIGGSLMVVWGGYSEQEFADSDFHAFNLGEFILRLNKTVNTSKRVKRLIRLLIQ